MNNKGVYIQPYYLWVVKIKTHVLMEWERKRRKEGRERWERRKRIDLFILFVSIVYIFFKDKLQITPLNFESVWILYLEISEFGFYPLKFGGV